MQVGPFSSAASVCLPTENLFINVNEQFEIFEGNMYILTELVLRPAAANVQNILMLNFILLET